MKQIIIVGLGGFIGTVARFTLGAFVFHHTVNWRFPISTFIINVLGCFIIGLLSGAVERYHIFTPAMRVFLFPGIIGGFTTFSAFSFEGIALFRRGDTNIGLLYAALSLICGFFAVWIGLKLFEAGDHPFSN